METQNTGSEMQGLCKRTMVQADKNRKDTNSQKFITEVRPAKIIEYLLDTYMFELVIKRCDSQ